jgi:hypothetical protein
VNYTIAAIAARDASLRDAQERERIAMQGRPGIPENEWVYTDTQAEKDRRALLARVRELEAALRGEINSLELRIEQLNDDYDSQEAFIDMQAEQLRKAKNMIARIALAAGLYLSEDFEVYS